MTIITSTYWALAVCQACSEHIVHMNTFITTGGSELLQQAFYRQETARLRELT